MRVRPFFALALSVLSFSPAFAARDSDNEGHGGRARVTFYEHADFRGGSITLEVGQAIENLTRMRFSNGVGMNDRISSIRIDGDAQVVVFRDAGFRGDVTRFGYSVSDLSQSAPGWNDAISSLKIEAERDDHRHGRGGHDVAWTDRLIQKAYRELLRRDPDENGRRSYRRHLLEDGWTEDQLRHSIRESDEFRELADRMIVQAFRDVLKRAPDRGELNWFRDQVIREGWMEEDVRRALGRDEYRKRPRH